ncbi:MAG: hypothetical protein AAFU49_12885 [Pseudomonadota bacterium]
MHIRAIITFKTFRETVEKALKDKSERGYKKAAHTQFWIFRKFRESSLDESARTPKLNAWLSEIEVSSAGIEWEKRIEMSEDTLYQLGTEARGSAVVHAIALHYRLLAQEREEDRAQARELDEFVFQRQAEEIFGPLFEFDPDEIWFPEPTAPFSYPPYKTRKNVERILENRPDHAIWLDPHNHHTIPLEGREEQQRLLTAFMSKTSPFRICPVIGPSAHRARARPD